MSTANVTSPAPGSGPSGPGAPQIPPQLIAPILDAYAAGIRAPLGLVLMGTIFSSMLIPLLIAMFWFSNDTTRQKPVFILNVFMILFGIALGIWNNIIELSGVLSPTKQVSRPSADGIGIALMLAPWLTELVLVLRLLVVFPPSRTPRAKLALVFAFPVLVKIVRLGVVVTYFHQWINATAHAPTALQGAETQDYRHTPYTQIEWFLQIFDNAYLSTLFIWKLRRSQALNRHRVIESSPNSFASRIRSLFWIALGNFVIPVIFNIALIIDLYTDPNHNVNIVFLIMTNYYVSIYAVVFATVWSTSSKLRGQQSTYGSAGSSQDSSRARSNDSSQFSTAPAISSGGPLHVFPPTKAGEAWERPDGEAMPLAMLVEKAREQSLP